MISYLITVTNSGTITAFYDLSDTLKYGQGINANEVQVSYFSGEGLMEMINSDFDGQSDFSIIESESVSVGMQDLYEVVVFFSINGNEASFNSLDCHLLPLEAGTGLLNQAAISGGVPHESDTACAQPPEVELACFDTVFVIGPAFVSDTIEAGEWLETIGIVIIDGNVVFNAPEILLQPGFEVPLGSEFLTLLIGCDVDGLTNPEDGKNKSTTVELERKSRTIRINPRN